MKIKKIIALFLSILLLLCCMLPAAAQEEKKARLYNVYGDHMLFQQNAAAVFAGEAAPGAAISVTLKNAAGETLRSAEGAAQADGTFSVSFMAPAGGYDAYAVRVTADGREIAALADVVFGELWLSFGQSNMEYNLLGTPEGREMQAAGQTGSNRIRVLQVPHPTKNGVFASDPTPQTDAQGCFWFAADSTTVYGMSAAAYFFAARLQQTLDVPVGVLNAAVGGSSLAAWISREAIDGSRAVTRELVSRDEYIALNDWGKNSAGFHIDMTGLYNSKIAPLTNFQIAGGIWYQGETDLILGHTPAFYAEMFRLLQQSYTAAFSHDGSALPLIFTQIAAYNYGRGPYAVTEFNHAFTLLAKEAPENRGEVTLYDVSLDYEDALGAIHPMTKLPVGQRMATAALGLVYDKGCPSTAPLAVDSEARADGIYVTFDSVGEGLIAKDGALRCFTVCGADGVMVPANAEIVNEKTVRVWNDDVADPVAAAYAAGSVAQTANLYSSFGGAPCLPAAPFGFDAPAVTKRFDCAEWLRCDTLSAWQYADSAAGMMPAWTAQNAALSLSEDAAEGDAALQITAQRRRFTVEPSLSETVKLKQVVFDSVDTDYRAYGTFSFCLKNTGATPVTLEGVRFYTGRTKYYTPKNRESGALSVVAPADGEWHTYVFDLSALAPYGGALLPERDASVLGQVTNIRLCFTGGNATLLADDFRFGPKTGASDAAPTGFAAFVAFVKTRLAAFFELFRAVFGKAEGTKKLC